MIASTTLMYRETHETADVVARQFAANVAVVSALAQSLRAAPPPLACAPLLIIHSFDRAASGLARLRGFNRDMPPHLNKVTETV